MVASRDARDGMLPGDWLATVAFPTMLFASILPWISKTGAVSVGVPVYGYETNAVFLVGLAGAGYVALWLMQDRGRRARAYVLLGGAAILVTVSLVLEPDSGQSCQFFRCEPAVGGPVAILAGALACLAGLQMKMGRSRTDEAVAGEPPPA